MKKKIFFMFGVLLLFLGIFSTDVFASAKLDPKLLGFIKNPLNKTRTIRVIAVMQNQIKKESLPKRYDTQGVVQFLKSNSNNVWSLVQEALSSSGALNHSVAAIQIHWINSSFSANVTPEGLKTLSFSPYIIKIYFNGSVFSEKTIPSQPKPNELNPETISYDLKHIHLDQLADEYPLITGKDILIGHLDTGIEATHPALQNKIKLFYNNELKAFTDPSDSYGHGTHTAGTMVGGNRTDNLIGLAPEAKLVSSGPLDSYTGLLNGMEFFLNSRNENFARAINNSWNCDGAPDLELFYKAITAWEAAGILPIFSAGNNGPNSSTITKPHELPATLVVASTSEDGLISDFSSRGPAIYHGQISQKPDLSAPGNNIRSSVPGGTYDNMSGTSMAAPHVTGAAALVWQANPKLTPAQVRHIFTASAHSVDLNGNEGTPGTWNASYGYGKLDVLAAVKMALSVGQFENQPTPSPFGDPIGFVDSTSLMSFYISKEGARPLSVEDFTYSESEDGTNWVLANDVW